MGEKPKPYTLDELRRYLAANSMEFGGWGLDTARWYATVDELVDHVHTAEAQVAELRAALNDCVAKIEAARKEPHRDA